MKHERGIASVPLLCPLSIRMNAMPLVEIRRTPLPKLPKLSPLRLRPQKLVWRLRAATCPLFSVTFRYLSYAILVFKTSLFHFLCYSSVSFRSNSYLYRHRLISILDPLPTTQYIILWYVMALITHRQH